MSDRTRWGAWDTSVGSLGLGLGLGLTLGLTLALALAACGGDGPASSGSTASQAPQPTTDAANRPVLVAPLVVDAGLLRILPAAVDGVPIQASPDSAANLTEDPSLAGSASALAVGLVVAPGDSGRDDLAISTVVRLRPGIYSDAFYRQWRTAYDTAACDPAGGVSSHVQRLIGPHTVEVTVCAQGARTYHTHLAGDVLVSITAVGDRRFGDLVMAGLRE